MATKTKAAVAAETEETGKPEFDLAAYYNEPVEFELFKDDGKYKDDVYVGINGKRYLVKRGERVRMPRCVALELQRSNEQRKAADSLITFFEKHDQVIGE